jgi:hypothetical protein
MSNVFPGVFELDVFGFGTQILISKLMLATRVRILDQVKEVLLSALENLKFVHYQ